MFNRVRSRLFGPAKGVSAGTREPRLIALSVVKNEQDIIEPFLRHHAALLDAIVLLDNASLDRTREIALACARELGTVVLGDTPEFSFLQAERTTRLLGAAQAAFRADYVFFLDADEFIAAPNRAALVAALAPIPPNGAGLLPWRTYVVRPGEADAIAADPPSRFTHRRRRENPQYNKVALRLDGRGPTGLTISQGHHTAARDGVELVAVPLPDLPLLHFPVRSSRQITCKAVIGWAACVARDPAARQDNLCFQWRDAFDRLTSGGQQAIEQNLATTSFGYAQEGEMPDWAHDVVSEPLPPIPPRRYSDGGFADPVALIAASWERSLASASEHAGDATAPARFLIEKRRPDRVLLMGREVDLMPDGLQIVVTQQSEPPETGDYDLAIATGSACADARLARLGIDRIMLAPNPQAVEASLRFWTTHGYGVDLADSRGARALAAQPSTIVVLVKSGGTDVVTALEALGPTR